MANATLRYRQSQYKSCSLLNSREQDAPTTFNNYGFHLRRGLTIIDTNARVTTDEN